MKNLHHFLNLYSTCPVCGGEIFTEIVIVFDAKTQRDGTPFKLNVTYIRDASDKKRFKYIKYRDDDDRQYSHGFDRSTNIFFVEKGGNIVLMSNIFAVDSYVIYAFCQESYCSGDSPNHFTAETREVYPNSSVLDNRKIKVSKEEIKLGKYILWNDHDSKKTKIYIEGQYPAKMSIKLIQFHDLNSKEKIISKIESLMVLV